MAMKALAARLAYGALFSIGIPALLAAWAVAAAPLVGLPCPAHRGLGLALSAAGLLLWASGVQALWRKGGGLPMNAFSPPHLVISGVYRLVPHPIYAGFCLLSFGLSIAARSPAGLWLVSPVLGLACASLVYGYEQPDLERRFGPEFIRLLHRLPPAITEPPDALDFLRFHLLVSLPWLAVYEAGAFLTPPGLAVPTTVPFESRLPVWPAMEIFYGSIYLAVVLLPLVVRSKAALRLLAQRMWLSMALIFPGYFIFPTCAQWRDIPQGGAFAGLLTFERSLDSPTQAFPSFHVVWAVLIAAAGGGWALAVWAALVSLSCLATGMHSLADVLGGAVFALAVLRAPALWGRVRAGAEHVANSWREWRAGPLRIINHGLYAGAAAFVCVMIVGALAGPGSAWIALITGLAGLVGSGLWAQLVEGSPRLLRPFGFYGGLFAVMAASLAAPSFGADPWRIMAAYCVAGPWLQSIGRLRCLVQGCCHGRPASPNVGIRYRHPRSRVCRLAGLAGVPLHPAPVYSILWNIPIALVLTRLWSAGCPLALIGGLYLILTGIGRFAEEAYRGEPQTPSFAGLRLYQWIAIATVLGGIAITCLVRGAEAAPPAFRWSTLPVAALLGLAATVAMGVDFPESNRRFARLA